MKKSIIGYIRVSTKVQGASGLGLEAQQAAIEAFAERSGVQILKMYTEVESGRNSGRPELKKALSHAKRSKSLLVVAKLDRLARNVAFTAALMESGVDFVACDNPTANRLTIHILAAVAEAEAEAISIRTKAALQAFKARGGKLGASNPRCRNLNQEARLRGAKAAGIAVAEKSREGGLGLTPILMQLRSEGMSQKAIAEELNRQGHTTAQGKNFTQVQVMRMLRRYRIESGKNKLN